MTYEHFVLHILDYFWLLRSEMSVIFNLAGVTLLWRQGRVAIKCSWAKWKKKRRHEEQNQSQQIHVGGLYLSTLFI